jgi:2-dehydropantoate 2-reductase
VNEPLRIVIVGAGAVGGWMGGRLAQGGHAVTLVGRQHLADAVAAEGLRLRSPDNAGGMADTVVTNLRVVTSLDDASAHGPFDLALFTVKTYDTDKAIAEMQAIEQAENVPAADGPVARRQSPGWGNPTILTLQNGIRSEQALAEAFGPERIVAGTELSPISVPQTGTILLEKRRGGIGLAAVSPDTSIDRWVQVFDDTVLATRAYADYRSMKWSKLLLNLIGNASAAILDMSTVEVYADRRLFRLEIDMLREGVAAMRGLGLKPVKLPGYPVPLLAWGVRWAPSFLLGLVMRRMVAGGRGNKPPSLLLELRRGRQRSEVAELNGAVVRAGEQIGLPTPVNRTLAETLTRLVSGCIKWDGIRHQPDVLMAVATEMKRKDSLKQAKTD